MNLVSKIRFTKTQKSDQVPLHVITRVLIPHLIVFLLLYKTQNQNRKFNYFYMVSGQFPLDNSHPDNSPR